MFTQKRIYTLLSLTLLFLISTITIAAQPSQAAAQESNLEAVLHVLGPSDQGESVPSSLAAVSRQLRSEFGVSNLRLVNTYLGRMSTLGALEYKAVSDTYVQTPMPGTPSFLNWQLIGARSTSNTVDPDTYQFTLFNFGARVPVRMGSDESKPAAINYESIGFRTDRLSVKDNIPTLVGTLIQPKTNGTLYLVLTVKKVDR